MPGNGTEWLAAGVTLSGGAGERNDRRCHMRLKLLEFAEWSKKYQRPNLREPDPAVN